jgi:hypothetical protein
LGARRQAELDALAAEIAENGETDAVALAGDAGQQSKSSPSLEIALDSPT